jgi:ATP-dependent DNA helicase PIF1
VCTVVTTVHDLISKIHPDIAHIHDKPMEWLCARAILTPKNDQLAAINDTLLTYFEWQEKQYTSIDTAVVNIDDATNYPVEFLNSLKPPSMPHHRLILRVGTPIMLLRNLKPPKLCNGTRLKVKTLHRNIVEATVLTERAKGETVFVPRIPLIPNDLLFEFKRFSSLKSKLSNLQE